jgi:hypothetical protein
VAATASKRVQHGGTGKTEPLCVARPIWRTSITPHHLSLAPTLAGRLRASFGSRACAMKYNYSGVQVRTETGLNARADADMESAIKNAS